MNPNISKKILCIFDALSNGMPFPMVRFFLSHTMQCTVGKLLKVSMSLICGAWQKHGASGMMPSIHPQYL